MSRVFLTGIGIYNLDAIRRDFDISRKEFCEDLGISTGTYRMYILQRNVTKEMLAKINDYIENLVDDPDYYLLSNLPYVPEDSRGRRVGSKNKNGKVRQIPVKEYMATKNENVFEYKSRPSTKHYVEGEEIFSALKNGETIYQEGSQDRFTLLQDENFSVIVKSRGDKMLFFNPAMDLEATYYTLYRNPLHLEVGRSYVNKQDQKVTIFAGAEDGTFKGIITGEPQVYSYSVTGEFLDTAANSNQKDLVEELA